MKPCPGYLNFLSFFTQKHMPNLALNPAPFGRWTQRDKAAQRRLSLR